MTGKVASMSDAFSSVASLADFVQNQASWRRAQATKFPNDVRNPRSADALESLAISIMRLSNSDPRFRRLQELAAFTLDGRFHAGTATQRYISRVGFDNPAPALAEFLDRVIDAVTSDRADARTGAWSMGVSSWRWQYPPGYTATYHGQLFDVVEAIAEIAAPPEFVPGSDGTVQIAPRALSTSDVRFRLRPYEWSDAGNERWIALDELEDGPHLTRTHAALLPDRKHLWPQTELDGTDTYRRGHGPLEVGIVEKFELPRRDTDKGRMIGDYIEVTGTEYRDVIVALETHPIETLRYVRVVRMRTPTPTEPPKATSSSVRTYMNRCAERNLAPSGWVNHLPPNWWQGMDVELLMLLAEPAGPDAEAAADELRRQNYWRSHTGQWMQQFPAANSTGLAIGGTTATPTRRDPGTRR